MLIFLAGIFNAVQDTIAHHWESSIFIHIKQESLYKWFRSDWRDKPTHPIWFVWDAWHCFKTLEKLCYVLIIYFIFGWVTSLISAVMLGIGFNLFYKWILIIRRNNS